MVGYSDATVKGEVTGERLRLHRTRCERRPGSTVHLRALQLDVLQLGVVTRRCRGRDTVPGGCGSVPVVVPHRPTHSVASAPSLDRPSGIPASPDVQARNRSGATASVLCVTTECVRCGAGCERRRPLLALPVFPVIVGLLLLGERLRRFRTVGLATASVATVLIAVG